MAEQKRDNAGRWTAGESGENTEAHHYTDHHNNPIGSIHSNKDRSSWGTRTRFMRDGSYGTKEQAMSALEKGHRQYTGQDAATMTGPAARDARNAARAARSNR